MELEQARRDFFAEQTPETAMKLLLQLMRYGKISEPIVRYCAALGDEACSMIFRDEDEMSVRDVLKNFDKKFNVEFAVWCAEKVLPIFEEEFPEDDRPRLAIKAAKNWLNDPSEGNRIAAADAAAWAIQVADDAAAADAAWAAGDAPSVATDVAWAAAYAAHAATAATAATAAYVAADAAAYVAADAAVALKDTTDKELLIEYLMKDISWN